MNLKILQKIFLFVILSAVIFVSSPVLTFSEGAVQDTGDTFFLALPLNGQTALGSEKVVWKMQDDDQAKPAYEINLLDDKCDGKVGTLFLSTDREITPKNEFYVYEWNRNDSMREAVTPENGNYCIEVKAQLLNGTETYALSAKSNVTLTGKGVNEPEISSVPSNLNISIDQTFSYEMKASDEDSDTLTYFLVQAPEWLNINKDNGLVNGKPVEAGSYSVVIDVSDGKGGEDRQIFLINVSSNSLPTLAFDLSEGMIFSGSENTVGWQSSDGDGIERQSLEYSNDGLSWVLIGEVEESKKNINWDVNGLQNGEYYLRLGVTDASSDALVSYLVSDAIFAANQTSGASETSIIYNLSPLPNSEVGSNRLSVSGNFLSPENKQIDVASIQVFLDGVEISKDCTINSEGFLCGVTRVLESGLHKMKVTYRDSVASGEKEWTFSVTGGADGGFVPDEEVSDAGIPVSGVVLAGGVACVIILLLVIPWLIYLMWRKRKDDEFEKEEPVSSIYAASSTASAYTPTSERSVEEVPASEGISTGVAPASNETPAPSSEDAYAIGSQTIPAEGLDTSKEFEITEIEATEQPKWLTEEQSVDVDKAAKPVTPEGNVAVPNDTDEDSAITQPHGYGAPVPDDETNQ